MKIGYGVEGWADRAFLRGLRARWCPSAELVEGSFRGTTRLAIKRELGAICMQLQSKGAQVFVFLTDANLLNWRHVRQRELAYVPDACRAFTAYGVPDRNIECWLAANAAYLAAELGVDVGQLESAGDPKGIVHRALRDLTPPEREARIEQIVRSADLRAWIHRSPSFETFYEDARALALRADCSFPNERER